MNNLKKLGISLSVALSAGVFGGAVASSADYCRPIDDTYCVILDEVQQDVCCVEAVGGKKRLATCNRELYYCVDGSPLGEVWGPAFNCQSYGEACP